MSVEPDPKPEGGLSVTSGGDVNVGGDAAGRDVIKTTHNVTQVGMSAAAVQRLLISVGALVFLSTLCAFVSGAAVMFAGLQALDKPVGSSTEAALRFQTNLQAVQAQPSGQQVAFSFTEDEISSYVKFILGPQLGFVADSGKVRFVNDRELVVAGRLAAANGLQVAATFQLSDEVGRPLALTAAAAQLVDTGSPLGWTAVPTGMLQGVEARLNQELGEVQILDATAIKNDPANPTWEINLITR